MSDILPDPQNSPALKAAKIAVIILSSLIILALIALVVGAVMKLAGGSKKTPAQLASSFTLAPGSRIVTMDSQPGRLILRIRTATGEEIDIIDTQNGHLVGQVKATAEK
jgi:hypothetical protein